MATQEIAYYTHCNTDKDFRHLESLLQHLGFTETNTAKNSKPAKYIGFVDDAKGKTYSYCDHYPNLSGTFTELELKEFFDFLKNNFNTTDLNNLKKIQSI